MRWRVGEAAVSQTHIHHNKHARISRQQGDAQLIAVNVLNPFQPHPEAVNILDTPSEVLTDD